jgi:hypothetical protein
MVPGASPTQSKAQEKEQLDFSLFSRRILVLFPFTHGFFFSSPEFHLLEFNLKLQTTIGPEISRLKKHRHCG